MGNCAPEAPPKGTGYIPLIGTRESIHWVITARVIRVALGDPDQGKDTTLDNSMLFEGKAGIC